MAKNTLSLKYEHELTPGSVSKAVSAAGAAVVKGAEALINVPPGNVVVLSDFNVRLGGPAYDEHFATIKNSIKVDGYDRTRPITVFIAKGEGEGADDVITLEDGHTRLKAVLELIAEGVEIATIPAIPAPATRTLEDRLIGLKTANDGAKLTPYETAVVVKRLMNNGSTRERLAERLSYTDRYMRDLEILARTPKKVVLLMQEGKVSATEVLSTMKKDEANAATIIVEAVKAAEAKGKKKATGKDTKAAGKGTTESTGDDIETSSQDSDVRTSKGKAIQTLTFKYKAGEIVTRDAIALTSKLKGGDWWKFVDDKKTHAFIEYDLAVEIKLTYKMEDESDATETGETAGNGDADADVPTDGGEPEGETEDPALAGL